MPDSLRLASAREGVHEYFTGSDSMFTVCEVSLGIGNGADPSSVYAAVLVVHETCAS